MVKKSRAHIWKKHRIFKLSEVGAENWQREHYECKGNLFCRVGINVNYNNPESSEKWVWKSDCGVESNTEAQKGEASDALTTI